MDEKQLLIIGTKLGKTFKAETFGDDMLVLIGEKDATIKTLTDQLAVLTPDAEAGKAYRKRLIEDTIKAGVLLGEIKTDEANQKSETDFLMTVPIARLEVMADKAVSTARKQFPDKYEIPASDQTDREKANKNAETEAGGGSAGKGSLAQMAKERAEAVRK